MGLDHISATWCQYKSCRYWSSQSKYVTWTKSLESFSHKVQKPGFDQKKAVVEV